VFTDFLCVKIKTTDRNKHNKFVVSPISSLVESNASTVIEIKCKKERVNILYYPIYNF